MIPRAAWLTTITLALAMLTYIVSVPGSDILMILLPLAIVARVFVSGRETSPVPQWVIALATLGTLIYAGFRVLGIGLEIVVFAEFVSMLAVLKSVERWSARDDMQILIVAIFLVLAAAIESNALIVGLLLFIFVPLLGYTAMRLQIEGAVSYGRSADPAKRSAESRDHKSPLFGTFTTAFLLIMGIGVIAFMLLPRGVGDFEIEGFNRPVMGRATGFRNGVTLGQSGLISSDPTIVMEVDIRDRETNQSLVALGRVHYLRGAVLPVYEDQEWKPLSREDEGYSLRHREAGLAYNFDSSDRRGDIKQIIRLKPEASDGGILFTLWQPTRIEFDTPQNGEIESDTIRRTVVYGNSRTKLTNYEVFSRSRPRAFNSITSREVDPQFAENEQIRGLAEEVLESAGIAPEVRERPVEQDRRAAGLIESWLAESGEFSYTLDIRDAELGKDPIEWFLTDERTGHCEYFAAAMAAMCRSVGINTRVVTGYVVSEVDSSKNIYIVRRADAHAWVEVETMPGLWETFDPTPDVAGLHPPSEAQYRLIRRILDGIDGFWLTKVVSFDAGSQMELFGLDRGPRETLEAEKAIISGGKRALRIVLIVVAALLVGYLTYRFYRKPRALRDDAYGVYLPRAAQDVLFALKSHWKAQGRERPQWQGLVAHASGHYERELASMLTSAAFGPMRWSEKDTSRAGELLRELRNGQSRPRSSENQA